MKIGMRNPDGQPGWQMKPGHAVVWVWLDEKKVRRCVAADDVAGVVWVTTEPVRVENDEIVLERLTGRVEIRFLQEPAAFVENRT